MCTLSMVMDYGQQVWPDPWALPGTPSTPKSGPRITPFPATPPKDVQEAARERQAILDFMELVKKAQKFDESAGQPDCEDDEKMKLLQRISDRLDKIEQHLGLK